MMLLLKASLLLSVTLLVARLLRRAPAGARHQVWSLAFTALLGLPLLAAALPALDVPVPERWRTVTPSPSAREELRASQTLAAPAGSLSAPGFANETRGSVAPPEMSPRQPRAVLPSLSTVLRTIWIAGLLAASGTLLLSLARVRRLLRHARPIDDERWQASARTIGARLGIRRPARVVMSDAVAAPMAGGLWRGVVFVPAAAAGWDDEWREIVLAHELAHLASRDPLRLVAARLAVACYWFHPLAWLAARESAIAREQACDEAVLALGVRPSVYARTLLELAETMAPAPRLATALSIIEPSLLEKRLMAILHDTNRPLSSRRPTTLALGAALLTLSIAAAHPAARSIDITPPDVRAAAPAVLPAAVTVAAAHATQATPQRSRVNSACSADIGDDFSGYTNTDRAGAIVDRVGSTGGTRVIQRHFGTLGVCMLGEDITGTGRPSEWLARGGRIVLETQRDGSTKRLEVGRAGAPQVWQVDGVQRPFDTAAQEWRTALLAVMDRTWEIMTLRGEVSTLRGDISTLRGEESTLRGEISTLRGDVSTMHGRQSTVRGEESTLRGRISEITGEVSTLRGQISTEQGAISSLGARRYDASDAERTRIAAQVREHEAAIEQLERELRDFGASAKVAEVERQIRALDADGKVAAIDSEIRTFDEAAKTAAVERQIAALDVDGKIAAIEHQILALDADRRTTHLEGQLDDDLRRLEQALKAVR